jgi:hypothetical protein
MKGFRWVLKEDGTYEKEAVKYVEEDEDHEYNFISNEKEYVLDKEIN